MKLEQDDIVISGVGGYFPKSENMEQFKTALLSNEVLLSTRWKEGERGVSNKIGTCPSIEYFDTAFFGIHRQQATFMDPMQRLILERTFEALVDAGVNPQDIRGKRVGCFLGSSIGENDNLFYESIVSGFGVTGHSRAMMPNRVSYWLNLKGPSCAYDSNWINGIEVIQLAFDAVRDGHCESAIVGTANLALNSEISWLYNDMGILSPDGTTKAFDATASGYARSDGIVVMYIQRAQDAKRAYASIVNVATKFNGDRDGTLLDVDQPSMEKFMTEFYRECGVNPNSVDMVECYGSAQKNIDEAELNAIENVYCSNRTKPLLIGSVKTNTGHSEASATLFGIAKVLVAMETDIIPATLQYTEGNPNIPGLSNGNLKVVTENTKWSGGLAAVNGIGLSSSYAHILLRSNPKLKSVGELDDIPRLALASTRTEEGIQAILKTIKDKTEIDPEYVSLMQELFSKPIQGHLYRGYSILDKNCEVKQEFEHHAGNKRQIWFCYSGMGSQWVGMAKDLMHLPIFSNTIMKCHNALLPKGMDLLKIVTENDPTIFDNILHSFVGIAAVQLALTDILIALGITPDGIIGHSVGELGCAYADSCLTAEQMIMCAYFRGMASLEAELIPGMMAAVGMGYDQIKDQLPDSIEVACHNGPDSSTISGPTADMELFVKSLQDRDIFARLVNVSNIAYHSRYIKPAAPGLLKYLKEVIPDPVARSAKWISTSNQETDWGSDVAKTSSAEYHTNNLLSAVLFEEGSRHIPKDSVVIEIAPHGLLQAILKRSLKSGCTNIAMTQRGTKNGLHFLLAAIGKMYLAGLDLNVSAIFPKVDYPVSRGTCGLAPLVHWEHGESWRSGVEDKLNYLVSVEDIELSLNTEEYRHCNGHQLDDRIILPVSSYLTTLLKILKASTAKDISEVVFENLKFKNIITIPRIGTVPFYAMIQKGSGDFEVLSAEDIVLTGRVTIPENDKFFASLSDLDDTQEPIILNMGDIYSEFVHRGHKYSEQFKCVKNIAMTDDGSVITMSGNRTWQDYLEGMLQQNLFQSGEKSQKIMIPRTIQKISFSTELLSKDEEDVQISYNYSTGIISTKGLQVIGIKTTLLPTKPKLISFDSIEYVPLNKHICENMESVINYSMHIAINNFDGPFLHNISISEVTADFDNSLVEVIKNVASKYTQLNANISTMPKAKSLVVSQNEPHLIIFNGIITEYFVKIMTNSEAFVLVKTDKNILNFNDIVEVAKFTLREQDFSLLRRSQPVSTKVVQIKSDTLTAKDINKNTLPWVSELNKLTSELTEDENIIIFSTVQPIEGIMNFVHSLRHNSELRFLRFVFVFDKKLQDFQSNAQYFQKVLRTNHIVTIFKDGRVATNLPSPVDFKDNVQINLQLSSNVLDDISLKYIGINKNDESLTTRENSDVGLGNIDYVGFNKDKERVVGLATLQRDSISLKSDELFKWKIPDEWSLEDGCSIPHAYATAYFALLVKGKLKPGDTVLIHGGCTAIGLAAISIASTMGCAVYTTVSSDYQKAFIRKLFTCLRDRNILSSDNTSFEPHLLIATGGVGAQVILNIVSENLLQATIRCIADFGRFIQIGKYDLKENNAIGMSLFLRNTAMIGVNPDQLFEQSQEVKQQVHDYIADGIKNFVVRPLYRKIVEHQDIAAIINCLKQKTNIGKILVKLSSELAVNQLNIGKSNQFVCDPKASHLIYGGSAENWTDTAEWLVTRGARHIAITSPCKPHQPHINRRLSLLQSHHHADIIYTPARLHTKDTALELLSEVYFLGPIQTVFILPTSSPADTETTPPDIKSIHYLDLALRTTAPKALVVSLMREAEGVCSGRVAAGYGTYDVRFDGGEVEFGEVLEGLDDVLSYKVKSVVVKSDKVGDVDEETTQSLYKKLSLLLPSSPEELIQQSKYAPKKMELVQLPSAGPRRIRELPPVFIIPGLCEHKTIKDFVKKLLYPTFYAEFPSRFVPLKEAAEFFAKEIIKVYPRGPYNLIGISCGGPLALTITHLLQSAHNTQLTLLDASPTTITSALRHLAGSSATTNTNNVTSEVSLLTRVLQVTGAEATRTLTGLADWRARVQYAVELTSERDCDDSDDSDRVVLSRGLETLRRRVEELVEFAEEEKWVTGAVHLIRPTGSSKYDNCGLMKFMKQVPKITVSQGSHITMLNDKEIIDSINENVTVI